MSTFQNRRSSYRVKRDEVGWFFNDFTKLEESPQPSLGISYTTVFLHFLGNQGYQLVVYLKGGLAFRILRKKVIKSLIYDSIIK